MVEAVRSAGWRREIAQARVDGSARWRRARRSSSASTRFRSQETEPDIEHPRHPRRGVGRGARARTCASTAPARDQAATDAALRAVREAMAGERRTCCRVIMDALRAQATMGEIHRAMREAHGFEIPA